MCKKTLIRGYHWKLMRSLCVRKRFFSVWIQDCSCTKAPNWLLILNTRSDARGESEIFSETRTATT